VVDITRRNTSAFCLSSKRTQEELRILLLTELITFSKWYLLLLLLITVWACQHQIRTFRRYRYVPYSRECRWPAQRG